MKIFDKFLSFFRHKSPTFQEMIDSSIPRYEEPQEDNIFDSPFVAHIVKPVWLFWLRHRRLIIETIIGLGLLFVAILTYCRKQP